MELHNCTNTSSINMSTEDYLQSLQDEANKMMAPAVTFLLILALVGLIGNSLVLVVYWKKFNLNPTKVLIMTIAGVDLVANTGAIPTEVFRMLHYWNYKNPSLCQATAYLNAITTVSGGISLLAIAVVRYRKVCAPFGWQVTLTQSKFVSALAIFLGAIFSILYIALYGRMSKPTPCHKIDGYECYIDDFYKATFWPKVNTALFVLLYLLSVIPLVVLYILIGRTAMKHRDIQKICNRSSVPKHQHKPSSKPRHSSTREQVGKALPKLMSKKQTQDSVATLKVPDALGEEVDSKNSTGSEGDKQLLSVATNSSTSERSSQKESAESNTSETEVGGTSKTETCNLLTTPHNAADVLEMTNPVAFESGHIDVAGNKDEVHYKCNDLKKDVLNIDSSEVVLSVPLQNQNCTNSKKKDSQNKENEVMKNNFSKQGISQTKRTSATYPTSDKNNTKRKYLGHMTAMLIAISATYALSYLPYLVTSFYRRVFPHKLAEMGMVELSFYQLFHRFYFINSAANPIIYCLCDRKFRTKCLNLFTGKQQPQRF